MTKRNKGIPADSASKMFSRRDSIFVPFINFLCKLLLSKKYNDFLKICIIKGIPIVTKTPITDALQKTDNPMAAPNWLVWRVGLGSFDYERDNMIYVMTKQYPTPEDEYIGAMTTPKLAEEAVQSHNSTLRLVQDEQNMDVK